MMARYVIASAMGGMIGYLVQDPATLLLLAVATGVAVRLAPDWLFGSGRWAP